MITGFNTDVPYEGVTYHVQTEDKGLDSPLILSLVYVGGAIIASKRTPYQDLIGQGFDEQALTDRLQRQHKLIIAAIKAGRVEDLKRMSGPNGGAQSEEAESSAGAPAAAATGKKPGGRTRKKPEAAAPPVAEAPPVEELTAPPAVEAPPAPAREASRPAARELKPTPPQTVAAPAAEATPSQTPPVEAPILVELLPVEAAPFDAPATAVVEPEIVILTSLAEEINALGNMPPPPPRQRPPAPPAPPPAPPAVVIPTRPTPAPPTLDLDDSDEIYMTLLDDEGEFRGGQLATIKVYVGRGAYGRRPEADASVTVKVLGTSFRPLILTATTDSLGVGVVRTLLPRFSSGRAAILIRATKGEDAAEMRRIIHQ